MADENKSLLGLLNGIARHNYFNDTSITEEFLKDELYPDSSNDEFKILLQKSRGLIKSMASTDMDLGQLDTFLGSQVRKKEGGITEEQSKVYMKFWRSNRHKIHQSLVSNATWNNKLKNLSWRIDVKSRARHVDQINTPVAIVELQLAQGSSQQKDLDVVRLEMDEDGLKNVLHSFKDIEDAISKHTVTQRD